VSEAGKPAARSDLPTRFAAGVAMIAVALLATWLGGWPFRALAALAAALMLVEWADMHRVPRLWALAGAGLLAAVLLGTSEYLYPAAVWEAEIDAATLAPNWIGFGAVALAALVVGVVSRRLAMIGGALYVGIPCFAMISLSWVWEVLVFWVFVVTWATDILAYFAGRAIGGPKLAPRISPAARRGRRGAARTRPGRASRAAAPAPPCSAASPPGGSRWRACSCGWAGRSAWSRSSATSTRAGSSAAPASRTAARSCPAMAACSTASTGCSPLRWRRRCC
jgi:hypothetical protein